jgi:hypothetical protein
MGRAGFTYNSDSVVVEVGLLVELLLELSVLLDWPIGAMLANRPHGDDELDGAKVTYWTPPGCRAVLLTVLETIVRSDVE